jgi:CheY-like chemotaxis protein
MNTVPPVASGLRLLLAEDHPINQKVASLLLQRQGFQVDIVENGQEVLDVLAHTHYDVVLLDMQMPVMDGMETAWRLNHDPALQPRPYLIALTANALHGVREECIAAGMDDYLSKPIDMKAMRAALERAALHLGRPLFDAPAEQPTAPTGHPVPAVRFRTGVA